MAAAYGWTYREIDEHTLAEAFELFDGWRENTPTNILVRALVEGFGGKIKTEPMITDAEQLPPEMQNLPGLPVMHGRDTGLPATAPVFDIDVLRQKNAERLKAKGVKRV